MEKEYMGCDVRGIPLDPDHPWNKEHLTVAERRYLRAVAERLSPTAPPPELPPGHREALDLVFGGCGSDDGDLESRGAP